MDISRIIMIAIVALFVCTAVYFASSGARHINKWKNARSYKEQLASGAEACFGFGLAMLLVAIASLVYLTDTAISQPNVNTDWFAPTFLVTGFIGILLWIMAFVLHNKSSAEAIDECDEY